jgi:hypothetical protein
VWWPFGGGPAILQSAISKELYKFGAWRRKSTELLKSSCWKSIDNLGIIQYL